jgi:hypothetical protein
MYTHVEYARDQHRERQTAMTQQARAHRDAAAMRMQRRAARMARRAERAYRRAEQAAARARVAVAHMAH